MTTTDDTDDTDAPNCEAHEHGPVALAAVSPETLARGAAIFRALGDPNRLRTLHALAGRELCVSEIAALDDESVSTVSHRLRLLHGEGLVRRRRESRHIYYTLEDDHVLELVRTALHHAEACGRV